MASSQKQQIFDSINARLETILRANGYNSDVGAHVFPWKLTPVDDQNQLPAIRFRDVTALRTSHIGKATIHRAQYELEALARSDSTADEIRDILRDVVRALGVDVTLGGLAADIELSEDNFMIDVASRVIASGQMTATVTYRAGEYDE